MKKATLLKVINPILGVAFLIQVISVFFKDQIDYELFQHLHGIGGIVLTLGGGAHIILNWSWVKSIYFQKK